MASDEIKKKMGRVKALIQAEEYEKAAALLRTIDHPKAEEWLIKLKPRLKKKRGSGDEFVLEEEPKRKRRWWLWAVGGFVALLLCSLIGQAVGIIPTTEERQATETAEAAQAIAVQETNIALTPPTETPTIAPSSTITNTPLPTETATETPTPLPTSTPEPPPPPIVFNSSSEGQNVLIGPVDFPSGLYRARVTTSGFVIVDVEATSGTCDTGFLSLFNLFGGQASSGAENIMQSENCRGTIEISNTREPWTLEFEILRPQDAVIYQPQYSSTSSGMQPVIGPLSFPSGNYRTTATTQGFMIADVEPLSGDCDDGIFGLFNFMEGEAATGSQTRFESEDCIGVIVVGNTQDPWTLDFEELR